MNPLVRSPSKARVAAGALVAVVAVACSEPPPKDGEGGEDASADVGAADAPSTDRGDSGTVDRDVSGPGDGADRADAGPAEPEYCSLADGDGLFGDCSACDAVGAGCDTIDVGGRVRRACDCEGSGCPCGTGCGEIEIAPNIVVGGVCVR